MSKTDLLLGRREPDIFERFGFYDLTDDQKRDLTDLIATYNAAGIAVTLETLLGAIAQYLYPSIERLCKETAFMRQTKQA